MAKKYKAVLSENIDAKQMKKLDWLELEQVSIWANYQLVQLKKKKEQELAEMKKRMEEEFAQFQSQIDALKDAKY